VKFRTSAKKFEAFKSYFRKNSRLKKIHTLLHFELAGSKTEISGKFFSFIFEDCQKLVIGVWERFLQRIF
jgi:hypothetical protein